MKKPPKYLNYRMSQNTYNASLFAHYLVNMILMNENLAGQKLNKTFIFALLSSNVYYGTIPTVYSDNLCGQISI